MDESRIGWIHQAVDDTTDAFRKISDEIWDLAELRFKELNSSKLLADSLKDCGFEVKWPVPYLETAFVASYGSGRPAVGLLAEFDALSGMSQTAGALHQEARKGSENGHGCGHHLLGTAVVQAAVTIKKYLEETGKEGTIMVFGCPAEEGGSGKTYMAREGVFDDVDVALTWHPGTHNAMFSSETLANIQASFKFKGVSAHAAAAPHLGRSALDAVELMNIGVNYLREHMPSDARVHYAVTDTGGNSPNVVQAHAEVLYLIRAPKMADVESLYERVVDIAKGASLMSGTEVSVRFDKACSNYMPNKTLGRLVSKQMLTIGAPVFAESDYEMARQYRETFSQGEIANDLREAKSLIGKGDVLFRKEYEQKVLSDVVIPLDEQDRLLSGSTDVGDVSWKVPTAQFFSACAAIGTPMHTWQMVSQGKLPVAHRGSVSAAKFLTAAAIELFENPKWVDEAWEEHAEQLEGQDYRCPIPSGVYPQK